MNGTKAASEALLVELLTEELPPKALPGLGRAFAEAIHHALVERELAPSDPQALRVFATPRRLGALVADVRAVAPGRSFEQRLVPASVGLDAHSEPTAALRKKLDALGLVYDPRCIVRESDGRQQMLVYRGLRQGATLAEGLQAALQEAIERLPIPKVMNYQLADGRTTVQFARPVHGLLALHGSQIVPVHALGLQAGGQTTGHRFHAPGVLRIDRALSYEHQLFREGKVIASFSARRARIVEQLQAAAARLSACAVTPEALVDEVTALVEWPVVYESEFDAVFLEVPQNCLILTMQQNQRYFALQDEGGTLRNRFLLVSNIETPDPSAIIAGNARVVRARLADARFFFEQDRQHRLETRLGAAANVVYHHALGSQLQRVERLVVIARSIAAELPASHRVDQNVVARAALLAKADLSTAMVGEFPELQGEMGAIYARIEGEDEEVATAIGEHYRPRFSGDALPSSLVGACLALADKIESIAGLFGVGERPSGDRDPYALRRNALGILRILQERAIPLPLQRLIALALDAFPPADFPRGFKPSPEEIEQFLFERLRGTLLEQGYGAHEVDAVLSLRPGRLDRIGARMAAVRAFMQLPQAENLAAANKRIGNILKKAPVADASARLDVHLLIEPAERELAAAFDAVAPQVDAALTAGDDAGVLRALVPLKPPVDRFFDEVMVMVDEPKLQDNRLTLLRQLRALMNQIADISLLAAG
ncbi:MAG TPA: glycine--tRNA ligase subunit beta [Burkholderiaceae bacterium]|nr:glycine--tRNA ligase subunit beta [Burkholderiaceae bacterium]